MDYEKKYKEALERAKGYLKEYYFEEAVKEIFPELKEDGDEKTKKEIMEYITLYKDSLDDDEYKTWIAWLEKQGESYTKKDVDDAWLKGMCDAKRELEKQAGVVSDKDDIEAEEKGIRKAFNKIWEEKQGEQKPIIEMKLPEESLGISSKEYNNIVDDCLYGEQKTAEEVEPKFKVGDWCIDNDDGTIFQIVKVLDNTYTYKTNEGNEYSCTHYSLENVAHLWTIEDAKDGDVLAINWHTDNDSWEKIIIFKKYYNKGVEGLINVPCVEGYGNTFKNGKLVLNEKVPYYSKTWTDNLHPATKEQRDALMKAMADAGWEFDFDKKELKKIEQKPAWSEEDENRLSDAIFFVREYQIPTRDKKLLEAAKETEDWLKSLKKRIGG